MTKHVDNCGFYKYDKCCKIRKFAKDSSKVWENGLLIISENSNFDGNGEFGKNLSKVWQELKQDDKRRMSLILGFYEKCHVLRNQRIFSENTSKVWQNSNEKSKTGILYK